MKKRGAQLIGSKIFVNINKIGGTRNLILNRSSYISLNEPYWRLETCDFKEKLEKCNVGLKLASQSNESSKFSFISFSDVDRS